MPRGGAGSCCLAKTAALTFKKPSAAVHKNSLVGRSLAEAESLPDPSRQLHEMMR